MKAFSLTISAALALAACGANEPVDDQSANAETLPPPPVVQTTDPSGAAPPPNGTVAPKPSDGTAPQPVAPIPAAFHGRWGLTPADCTSTRGDAKGLLTVAGAGLQFYESRAVPVGNVRVTGDSFSADFAFTGEGMEWIKFQTLEIQGESLVRTESNPMASFTYARCS